MNARQDNMLVSMVLTPPGSGGIAVVRVTGSDAESVVAAHLRPVKPGGRAGAVGPRGLRLGWFVVDGEAVDKVLVRAAGARQGLRAGLEVCCHGGVATARRVMERLGALGVQERTARESLVLPLLLREAWEAAIGARSVLAARVFSRELDAGMMGRVLESDGVVDDDRTGSGNHLSIPELRDWLARASSGQALSRPPRVALVGPANAGKSTLFNALLGRNRALVSARPGTTRDPLRASIELDGYVIELWDTAGTGRQLSAVDQAAAERARVVADEADLLIHVVDGTVTSTRSDPFPHGGRPPLDVANKTDRSGYRPVPGRLAVSALSGRGLEALAAAIGERLGLVKSERLDGPTPFSSRHVECLRRALAARDSAERRKALAGLAG